jgi:hypothetical protein
MFDLYRPSARTPGGPCSSRATTFPRWRGPSSRRVRFRHPLYAVPPEARTGQGAASTNGNGEPAPSGAGRRSTPTERSGPGARDRLGRRPDGTVLSPHPGVRPDPSPRRCDSNGRICRLQRPPLPKHCALHDGAGNQAPGRPLLLERPGVPERPSGGATGDPQLERAVHLFPDPGGRAGGIPRCARHGGTVHRRGRGALPAGSSGVHPGPQAGVRRNGDRPLVPFLRSSSPRCRVGNKGPGGWTSLRAGDETERKAGRLKEKGDCISYSKRVR